MSIKVTLRKKKIKGNKLSLFLDFYPAIPHPITGKLTRREFLGKYLYAPIKITKRKLKDGTFKEIPIYDENPFINGTFETHNRETMQLAEQIRQQKENRVNKPEIYSDYEKQQLKMKSQAEENFVEYFKLKAEKRIGSNRDNWQSAYYYLKTFTNGFLRFGEIDVAFCNDFREYLLRVKCKNRKDATLSNNTAAAYFNKFKSTLREAYLEEKLQKDINGKIKSIAEQETIKNSLTMQEFQTLAVTDCPNETLKNAALFSVMTGMAFAEMRNLLWGNINKSEHGIIINFRRKKTQTKVNYLPISFEAFELLGEPKAANDRVFAELDNNDRYLYFPKWLKKAGIQKKITFHDLRRTFGRLQIELGTDIYTVQSQYGHSLPSTTKRYITPSTRLQQEAANKIKIKSNPINNGISNQ